MNDHYPKRPLTRNSHGIKTLAPDPAETNRAPSAEPLDFDQVYRQYGGRVLHVVYRFVRREEVARDLVQEIFIKIYQNMGSFRRDAHLFTWIYRITVNHVMNHLKAEKRSYWSNVMNRNVGDLLTGDQRPAGIEGISEFPQPDQELERAELRRIVREAVDSLPIHYRAPFTLFRYEEMSYQEIALALGISMSAVETRIHRAKKQLIKKLKPWLEHL